MAKFYEIFTFLLLFSIFAFCVAEPEDNHATINGKRVLLFPDQ